MTDEPDDLDLAAWEAPPPPKGLADAVLARVLATDGAIAVALRARRRHRALVGAACASAIAATVALWLGLRTSAPQVARQQPSLIVAGPSVPVPVPVLAPAPAPKPATPRAFAHGLELRHGDIAIAAGESPVIFSTRDRLVVEIQHECHAPPNAQAATLEVSMMLDGRPDEFLGQPIPVIPDADASDATSARYTLLVGTYSYTAKCGTVIGTGTIEVRQDSCRSPTCQAADRLALITEPSIGAVFGGGPVHVEGAVPEGTALSSGGVTAPVGSGGAFAFDLQPGAGQPIALRADHPTRGPQFYVQFGERAPGSAKLCDADALLAAGTEAMSNGSNSIALERFEAAYACKENTHTLQLAFMAACNAQSVLRARFWWTRLSTEEQDRNVVMCIRRGIGRDRLDGTDAASWVPDALDRNMIQSSVVRMHPQVVACGQKFSSASGKVKVSVKVDADGTVAHAAVETSPDADLGACVQDVMSHAVFPTTRMGGSFSYPFIFPM